MELHTAIHNILKYQGEVFLLDPKMLNALSDFNAFEKHKALKNIYRILYTDNIIRKVVAIGNWNEECEKLVDNIYLYYAFPRKLIDYIFKSILYGINKFEIQNLNLTEIESIEADDIKFSSDLQNNSLFNMPWSQLFKDQRLAKIKAMTMFNQLTFQMGGMSCTLKDVAETQHHNYYLTLDIKWSTMADSSSYEKYYLRTKGHLEYKLYNKDNFVIEYGKSHDFPIRTIDRPNVLYMIVDAKSKWSSVQRIEINFVKG